MFGCPEGAKGSTDLTIWPKALAAGAKLVTGARVREITTNGNGLATGALWVDRDGNEQRGRRPTSSCWPPTAIGTPRLLLLSGLANSSGLVGKRLMLHPYMSVLGLYDEELESWLGPWGTPLLSLQFADTDESRGFPRGAQWDVMPIGGPLMALARYDALPFERALGATASTSSWRRRWAERSTGASGSRIFRRRRTSSRSILELDGQRRNSRAADPLPDRRGRARPTSPGSSSARGRRTRPPVPSRPSSPTGRSGAGTCSGTCRMGDDPSTSVVDRFGRAHDVPNLYIIDGSVFVTSGPQPPTATIAANAHRCVEHLIQTPACQAVPA